jgi:hypothetical protein
MVSSTSYILCLACDFANAHAGYSTPILGILCDGRVFEFFEFDSGSGLFVFHRGIPAIGPDPTMAMQLPDERTSNKAGFVKALRPVCEILFSLFLTGYINGLEAFLAKSEARAKQTNKPRASTTMWEDALHTAKECFDVAKQAADVGRDMSSDDKIAEADLLAERAMDKLKERCAYIPFLLLIVELNNDSRSIEKAPEEYRRHVDFSSDWDDIAYGR